MKKILLSAVLASATVFSSNAQTKIYDFPFDNGSTNSIVGTGAFASSIFGITSDRNGVASKAISLSSQTITATLSGLPQGSASRTVCLWFNRQGSAADYPGLFAYGSNASLATFGMYFNTNGQLYFQGYASDELLEIAGVSSNTWHHLAVSYDGTNVRVYFNGTLGASFPKSLDTGNDNPFSLGNVDGLFDDLKIYDGALTASQVTEVYTNNDLASTASIENNLENNLFSTFPNPANENVTISNIEVGSTITLIDVTGKIVATQKANSTTVNLQTVDFNSGVYFVCVLNANGKTAVQKLIIE